MLQTTTRSRRDERMLLHHSFFGRDITASYYRDLIDASPAHRSQRPPSRCRSRTRRSGRPDSRTALCPRQTTDESGRTSSRRRGRGRPFENRVDAARSRKSYPYTEPRASDFVRGIGGRLNPQNDLEREGRSRPARVPRSRGIGPNQLEEEHREASGTTVVLAGPGDPRRSSPANPEIRPRSTAAMEYQSAPAASRGVSRSSRDSAPGPG